MVLFQKMQFQSVYSSKYFATHMTFCVSPVRTVVVLQRPTVSELLATSFTSELWRLQWGSKLWSTFNIWPENIFRCPGHNYRGKKHAEVNNFKNCHLNYQQEKDSLRNRVRMCSLHLYGWSLGSSGEAFRTLL